MVAYNGAIYVSGYTQYPNTDATALRTFLVKIDGVTNPVTGTELWRSTLATYSG